MADSAKDLQLRELKDIIAELNKTIQSLQVTIEAANKREEALAQERDNLKDELDLLRKKLFGSSSENRHPDIPGQLNLFNEAELEQNPEAATAEELAASLYNGSRLDKAVTYIQNRRPFLETYLEDGRCSFSNNLSENAIRPFTVGRKNWFF